MNTHAQVELDLPPHAGGVHPAVAPPDIAQSDAAPSANVARPALELWLAVHADESVMVDPARRAALLQRAGGFTPRVVSEPPDALLLELSGSQRLFGGLRPLLTALRAAFAAPLHLAMAPTPLAALALARSGYNGCITHPARLRSRLAPLPLSVLRWPEDVLIRLHDMGVTCVGDLLRLPRAGLARRIGPEHLRQLDRLVGVSADPRASVTPAERFFERIDPDEETFDRDRLLAVLAPSFERLEHFLRSRQRGITALRVTLVHRAGPPTQCVLRCVVAEYRAARFTALLAARLESLLLAQPVRRLELKAGCLRRFTAASGGLWQPGEQGGTPQTQLPEFLQILLARLGDRAVYGLAPVAEHRPERQWREVEPWLPQRGQNMSAEDLPQRPLGLLPQPLPLVVDQDEAGSVRGLWHGADALQLVSGPERIESGWWDGAGITRDYYIARAQRGSLLWIFRERGEPHRWFLHGCFA